MDHMQGSSMSHIVQVFTTSEGKLQTPQIIHISHPTLPESQPKVTYEHGVLSESLSVSESIVMPCQTGLQSAHQATVSQQSAIQSQILQSDVNQAIQFASHMILPHPVFKQHMLVDNAHYYSSYGAFIKEPPKPEQTQDVVKQDNVENTTETIGQTSTDMKIPQKRSRGLVRNPGSWACNVRKLKHQSGEAYINRRGKYVPEKQVRNTKNCLTNCRIKCNSKISDDDRELIFKAFYSLTANEKKHFLLNTTERHSIKNCSETNTKRQYSFKYFFLIRGVRHTVCKNFYLGTLAISQKPVYNVHMTKTDLNIPKPDGRGLSSSSFHAVPAAIKEQVRLHILTFKTADNLPVKQFSRKKQYMPLHLSIKQMYIMYLKECKSKNIAPVRESMYRKILREEFNLHVLKKPKSDQLCAKCKEPIKKKGQCDNTDSST